MQEFFDGIYGFRDDYAWLSNMWPCVVYFDKKKYDSSEHAYVAAKTLSPSLRDIIGDLPTPKMAKKFGTQIPIREDWDDVKIDIMKEIVESKFNENPDLKEKLLATGDLYIEETNWWNDTFWGVCNGVGKNRLGNILMELREKYRVKNKT
jgi:ribA/ribD-fused uncharacterized protein